jgi:hypothetical protein
MSHVFFQEAILHVRWKTILIEQLEKIFLNLDSFSSCKHFEEVFSRIENIFLPVYGIGRLSTYDTSAAICRHYKIPITKVYLFGGGPKKAVKFFNIKTHLDKKLKIRYCEVEDVLKVFGNKSMTADDLETSLCIYIKNKV